ncbi:unnamed protein product, partial [Symbiodinium natans]
EQATAPPSRRGAAAWRGGRTALDRPFDAVAACGGHWRLGKLLSRGEGRGEADPNHVHCETAAGRDEEADPIRGLHRMASTPPNLTGCKWPDRHPNSATSRRESQECGLREGTRLWWGGGRRGA